MLLFKSGLHLDYDGPAMPVFKLMSELAQTVAPKVFITTGTGGGIGTARSSSATSSSPGTVRFDCKTQFAKQPGRAPASSRRTCRPARLKLITPALTQVNASRIPGARPLRNIFSASNDAIVTTDFFAFDDSTNHYGLQGLGHACDMGDAMVARAMQSFPRHPMVRDPQRVGPADPQSRRATSRKRRSRRGSNLRPLRRADHRGQPHRNLGDHSALGARFARSANDASHPSRFKLGRTGHA